jgi:hypothetical protein
MLLPPEYGKKTLPGIFLGDIPLLVFTDLTLNTSPRLEGTMNVSTNRLKPCIVLDYYILYTVITYI